MAIFYKITNKVNITNNYLHVSFISNFDLIIPFYIIIKIDISNEI